ncbi:MAG: ATP-dependent helicase HrpB [Acidimicrobiales bacterium]|nr:ATP-dependent helicase HrpB [Acidimicrobiales bacterium]
MPVPPAVADLPVVDTLAPLGAALRDRRAAVLVAAPGAGKTTVVPLWLLDQPWLSGRIVMLEPRRLATRAAAQRMATLLGEPVGRTVGYQTRDERRIGAHTRVEVVTEGVLTRRLQHDPELPGVGVIVFDEVHERNLPTDLGLALALDVRATLRPDLRLLAMSATPDTPRLVHLLGDGDGPAPVVESEGREHPVEIRSLPLHKGVRLEAAVAEAVLTALRAEPGDVLVFLPGIGEIRRVEQQLASRLPDHVDIRPLAGALPTEAQDLALVPSPAGRRRVVLSTDIAESSLTVAGIRVVVDAGLARVPRFDPRTGMTRLTTVATSRASADQRAGRAGRTEPGVCYRLWSKLEQHTRLAHLPAEITQVDLAGLVLELAAWQAEPAALSFPDPPPVKALQAARALLEELEAITPQGAITPAGRSMLVLPVHPRLARMVVAAPGNLRPLACVVAALVDERDVLRGRADDLPADLATRVRLVCGDARDDRADRRTLERIRDRALDIAGRAGVRLVFGEVDPAHTGSVLALGFPDRVAARRSQVGQFQLRTGGGAWVAKDDPLAREPFVVAADLDGNRTSARIRLAAGLDADELEMALADHIDRRETLVWDKQRNDLVLRVETRLGNMTVGDHQRRPERGAPTVAALLERVRATRLAVLDVRAADGLRARLDFVRRHDPDGGWPDTSDRHLLATLDDWLAPFLLDATGRADLERLDVPMLLANQLDWDRQMRLADLAPATIDTPSGRHVPIDYARDHPTTSVRVQDLFGLTRHPMVGGGRIAVSLELLSPADRPIQITSDLPGFWAGSWAEVRKEMAGRYPKHHWPLDPSVAPPKRLKDR